MNRINLTIQSSLICLLSILLSCNSSSKQEASSESDSSSVQQSAQVRGAMRNENLEENLKKLNDRVKRFPGDPQIYFRRSIILNDLKKNEKALEDMNKALSLDSMNADYYMQRAKINWDLSHAAASLEDYKKTLLLRPESTEAFFRLGRTYFYVQEYELAFENLNEALRIDKLMPEPYYYKGLAYFEMGDTARAVSNWQTTIELEPDHYEAYFNLGRMKMKSQPELAIDYFNNAIRVNRSSIDAHLFRAYSLQLIDSISKAITDYEFIINKIPLHSQANYNLGYLNYQEQEFQTAIEYLSNVIQSNPAHFNAYLARALCYYELDQKKEAEADLNKAIQLDPEDPYAQELKAKLF